ncbi:GNAT family N-acetyltransferase [Nesterenkonia populi]|uniref:GNAT family N-acetyltransferase n=1 Tax=Nesterenkonia populi TaxID=1591087 RepID=UPI0011BDF1A6|nr:GNAT family N-acetyltransferase [Nesterenkonia populi]
MTLDFRVTAHHHLTGEDLDRLRVLFDREYFAEYGPWTPDGPYGYSPAEVHVMAFQAGELRGHVGFQPRTIAVGEQDVTIAGTGGVLVAPETRGSGLGRHMLHRAQEAMRHTPGVEFGYLGCRPAVVPFYEAAGWHRIHALERHLSRLDPSTVVESDTAPILICAAARAIAEWPDGDIDLRGGTW